MQTSELNQYLHRTLDALVAQYVLHRTLEEVDDQIAHLGIHRAYREPEHTSIIFSLIVFVVTFVIGSVVWAVIQLICSVIIGIFFSLVAWIIFDGFENTYETAVSQLFDDGILSTEPLFLIEAGIMLVIGIITAVILFRIVFNMSLNDLILERKEKKEYALAIQEDHARVQKELIQKNNLRKKRQDLHLQCARIDATANQLIHLREKGRFIIYQKYQTLPAIAKFCEYFDSGRCTTLEGHEGAYNLLETDLHFDQIDQKLDTIIDHLETIRQNQTLLYHEIKNANQNINHLIASANSIDNKLDDCLDYQKVIAANTSALTFLELYRESKEQH